MQAILTINTVIVSKYPLHIHAIQSECYGTSLAKTLILFTIISKEFHELISKYRLHCKRGQNNVAVIIALLLFSTACLQHSFQATRLDKITCYTLLQILEFSLIMACTRVFVSQSYYKIERGASPLVFEKTILSHSESESVTNDTILNLITGCSSVNYSLDLRPAQSYGTLN